MIPVSLTVIGSINEDVVTVGARLPGPGETVMTGDVRRIPGGKGANQAAAAGRLAGRARMIGARGDDDAGRRSIAALASAGVDVAGVDVVERPTGTALIVIDAHGENQIAVAPGANQLIQAPSSLADADAILCQLEVPIEVVMQAARECSGFVALNAAPAQTLPQELIERCDLIIVNETEFGEMPQLSLASHVAVTYGAAGAALFERGVEVARVPGRPAEVVSSVGAGDAFCAALVIGLLRGLDERTALATACAVGAAAVESPDAQPAFAALEEYVALVS